MDKQSYSFKLLLGTKFFKRKRDTNIKQNKKNPCTVKSELELHMWTHDIYLLIFLGSVHWNNDIQEVINLPDFGF